MQPRRILLVSSDLMASSRLAGVARGLGDALDVRPAVPTPDHGAAPYDVVLLDIQSCPDPATAITRGRAASGQAGAVIAFGPHVWKERLDATVAAGADAAVSRGEVLEGLAGLLDRTCPRRRAE
jgi:hypothetical protein